ncbi:hypothetical protein K933_14918 [Candidatus Halobonum tyrrellensis G22]|uniref:HTH bat-type domain-containing protein n=2 Tax=Candidatus Halobonum TaxID=1431544 RepID=V4HBG8_9EURY|nr:hypothetical protein K933_14918 [Candidatus Halobonum tyrrellensis G22]
MREATLRIRHNGQPECEVSASHPNVTMRSVSSMTGRRAERRRIIELTGDPDAIPSFVEAFREAESIVAAESLTPLGEDRVYVALTFDATSWDGIADLLAEYGVHHRVGTVISAGWERWTLYLDSDDDLGALIDHIESRGNDVKLVRQVEMGDLDSPTQFEPLGVLSDLSPRQREALAVAVATGYYGYDRDAGIEDVADELGIGTTTAWEHLARAEGKLMGELEEYLG